MREKRNDREIFADMAENVSSLNDTALEREVIFARAFGGFDKLAGWWWRLVEAEAALRKLRIAR